MDDIILKEKLCLNEVAAFGDGLNDIPMFKRVELAIAMDNVCHEIKKIATHITRFNDEDLVNCLDYKKICNLLYYIYIQLKKGLRFGEVLGLTWDCIDGRDKEIRTYRRYDSISYEWKPPKTESSVMSIPIDDAPS
ncbi:HAD hydrolase family protein [Streptococcus dysgalactiae]|uniref:HAD hydrolase family protein n=1 Tax=Streptococcus dysgalactiae TaxID=1334 RepID=UPI002DD44F32|nr:HAD hydrolase family protein [Streptococcus dysgalactiae]MEC4577491.1 HAD hydrolase family protein [Streptococcus dysgalactiae]